MVSATTALKTLVMRGLSNAANAARATMDADVAEVEFAGSVS
jgi:hypothetical protein